MSGWNPWRTTERLAGLRSLEENVSDPKTTREHPEAMARDAESIAHQRDENRDLRRLLFLFHGHSGPDLYGDDGEMQCKRCGLDYRRDPLAKIEGTLLWNAHNDAKGEPT